ncbi:MAG: L-2-hydroxyglutarate oxidase [Desulfobacterales bacterium]|nr:L-2-hydroxyglutarate oxidase [Desulfobacterales bacterium]
MKASIVICGAGIIGLTIAKACLKLGHQDILIIEKESHIGAHASGRNSGVLHAGIYYDPQSMRAHSCLAGNRMMQAYCKEKNLPLKKSGKVIVASSPDDIPTLKILFDRAQKNGANVALIDEKTLSEIEPEAKTCSQALYSFDTAVVNPKKILNALLQDLINTKTVKVSFNTAFQNVSGKNQLMTSKGKIEFDYFINAGGAYSDVIAKSFGLGQHYRIIPFKGIYKQIKKGNEYKYKGNIYPVPNIKNPFLGVHFTKHVHGDVYLGPTAIPAFGRENYRLLEGLNLESLVIFYQDINLLFTNKRFRQIAKEEPLKYHFTHFFRDAQKLVKHLNPDDIITCSKVGIRPQLIDLKTHELVMDFVIEQDERAIHVLNPISPAFTSSMAIADEVVNRCFT